MSSCGLACSQCVCVLPPAHHCVCGVVRQRTSVEPLLPHPFIVRIFNPTLYVQVLLDRSGFLGVYWCRNWIRLQGQCLILHCSRGFIAAPDQTRKRGPNQFVCKNVSWDTNITDKCLLHQKGNVVFRFGFYMYTYISFFFLSEIIVKK